MGGVGSGNWYRLDKKGTTDGCHSLDVRDLHRDGLLKTGSSFSTRWLRGDRQTGSISGFVHQDGVILSYGQRRRSGSASGVVPTCWSRSPRGPRGCTTTPTCGCSGSTTRPRWKSWPVSESGSTNYRSGSARRGVCSAVFPEAGAMALRATNVSIAPDDSLRVPLREGLLLTCNFEMGRAAR